MKPKRTHNRKSQSNKRKYLRSNLTPAEAYLWTHLKSKQLMGRKFNKQHGFGPYIVDFYCASERLIIELDGEYHNNPQAVDYDQKRTVYFENLDYTVVRFENYMVFQLLPSVLKEISDHFDK